MATEKRPARDSTARNPARRTDSVIGLVPQPESLVFPRSTGRPKRSLAEVADTLIMDPRQLDFWRFLSCVANENKRSVYRNDWYIVEPKVGTNLLRG
jgi:hypothetical protein